MQQKFLTVALSGMLFLAAAACGSDDGADVRTIGETGSAAGSAVASGSASGVASGSASGVAAPSDIEEVTEDGGYTYASDVNSHRRVTLDVCAVIAALDSDPVDFSTAATAYREGGSSPDGDAVRTLAGFATSDDREHGLREHFGSDAPLDDFVTAALDGTGVFDGEVAAVRAQGVEKGLQNQTMVAWMVHELNSALNKVRDGNIDPDEGAPHNWDEAWAFYHGAQPSCAPHATADKRAANFGTVAGDTDTATTNVEILTAMQDGQQALLDGDVDRAETAADEVMKQLVVTYSQAAIRYASLVPDDLAADDLEGARIHQAEGWAFWRVIEAYVAGQGADVDAVDAILNLSNEPGSGDGDDVRTALQPAWDALGITSDDIGVLS